MSDKIIIPDGIHTEKTKFVGSPHFNVIGMYYLSHKYDNICTILSEPYKTDLEKSPHWFIDKDKSHKHKHKTGCVLLPKKITDIPDDQREVSLRWVETKGKEGGFISVPKPTKKFWKNFAACSQKRFIVLPFGFTCKDSGHANYLLYDRQNFSMERYETYGRMSGKCTNPRDLDNKIKQLFQDNLGEDFIKKYYEPLSYLPERNIQTIQEAEGEKLELSGFCGAYSILWIELRLLNPDIERDELAELFIEEMKRHKRSTGISHTQFIRNYSGMIANVSEEIKNLYKQHENIDENKIMIYDGIKKVKKKSHSRKKRTHKKSHSRKKRTHKKSHSRKKRTHKKSHSRKKTRSRKNYI